MKKNKVFDPSSTAIIMLARSMVYGARKSEGSGLPVPPGAVSSSATAPRQSGGSDWQAEGASYTYDDAQPSHIDHYPGGQATESA